MIRGRTRGRSATSVRRDTPKVCVELREKHADIVVVLTDSDDQRWRDALTEERRGVPGESEHCVICGVAARNVECWLVLNRPHAAKALGVDEGRLDADDPKSVVHRALGISSRDLKPEEKVEKIAEIVRTMPPLGPVLQGNTDAARSLKQLYEDARDCAQRHGCGDFPNELE